MNELRKILKKLGVREKRFGTRFDFFTDTFSVSVHQYKGKLYELDTICVADSNKEAQWSLVDRDTVIAYFEEDLRKEKR